MSDLLKEGILLKDFIKKLQYIYDKSKGTHHYDGDVRAYFYLDDPLDKIDVDIDISSDEDAIEPWMMLGCGCWAGAHIKLVVKRKENPNA